MSTISVQELQHDLGNFLRRVQAGEAFLVVNGEQPVAEVHPVSARASQPRPYGLCAGQFRVPDDFNAPLPEEVLRDFEGA